MDDFDIKITECDDTGNPDTIIRTYTLNIENVLIKKRALISKIVKNYINHTMGINHTEEIDNIIKNEFKEMLVKDTKLMRKIKLNKIKRIYEN